MAEHIAEDEMTVKARQMMVLGSQAFDDSIYEFKEDFVPGNPDIPLSVHTIPELIECLKRNPDIEIEAKVISFNGQKERGFRKLDRKSFLKFASNETTIHKAKLKESIDSFNSDMDTSLGFVGDDFTPLLGGPFNKQLYYRDYLRMHAAAFWAGNHDPLGRAYLNILTEFVMGGGYRVDCKNPIALALWRAFEEVNNLPQMMNQMCKELAEYGEVMLWELPNNDTKIVYNLRPGEQPPKGIIPRFRMIDPSVIWEIVTYPEDITRPIFYQWVAPTQYQTYTDGKQPTLKFIFQQVPAEQVIHHKINCASNEKRGRSDFFPVLGYMKRLRDSVNYSIIAMQKAAAWSMDTTIKGNETDLNNYVASQEALGSIPQAGSEFVHTEAVKREYLSNSAASKGGQSQAFEWCMSLISAGLGIPTSYWGTHLSGGQTRASAVVATEPVAKKFELRQQQMKYIIQKMSERLFKKFGIDETIEITFPEIITQDRSIKLKDVKFAEDQGWISGRRASIIAAKELDLDDYDYDKEQIEIKKERDANEAPALIATSPLTAEPTQKSSMITSDEKRGIKNEGT